MTNIGLLGAVSVGKTSILRLFVKYLKKNMIETIEGGKACDVNKTDFSGETVLNPSNPETDKETKTVHPNRVMFKEKDNGRAHTVFAPGGDRTWAVVRMGIITISRIAKQIVAVFAADRPLKEQFEFFNDVRYFPKQIYLCFNKYDLIKEDDKEKFLKDYQEKVEAFFGKRKIKIKDVFITVADTNKEFKEFNDNTVRMILDIAKSNA
ncbi:MAG: hypothetical protein GF364_02265 [Candidatus Lokiarchaeota archaeon]|nr:hypothetical protein [Candidatus Lokiarchaeota archaeon]